MTAAIDSNVLLRLLLNDVPSQGKAAQSWLIKQSPGSVVVTDSVLVEVLLQLESKVSYGLARRDFMPELAKLLSLPHWRLAPTTRHALGFFTDSKLDYTAAPTRKVTRRWLPLADCT